MKDGGLGFMHMFCLLSYKLGKLGTGRRRSSYLYVQSMQAVGHFFLDSLEILLATHTLTVSLI